MVIDDTISKDNKANYETKSFKAIETFSYNGAAEVETLHDIDLEILTLYALKGPIFIEKCLRLFSRVLKGPTKTQFEEDIGD